jgi:adenosine deaminase
MEICPNVLLSCILLLIIDITNSAILKSKTNTDVVSQYFRGLIVDDTRMLSELNMFVTAMPKGGDLHHHYSGSIYAETYLGWVAKNNYCIYRDDEASLKIEKYRIETRLSGLSAAAKALCITADAARLENAFYRELLKRWSDIDYRNHYQEQPPPDRQFFDTFGYFSPVASREYAEGLKWLKNTAINEHVQYIETMLSSGPNLRVTDEINAMVNMLSSKSNDTEIDRVLTLYFDTITNDTAANVIITDYVQMTEAAAAGVSDDNFMLRFQAYVSRGSAPSRVFASLCSSFLATVRSDLIVGVNIVGPENGIVAMRDYTLHMKMFRFLKQRYPNVKLAMHAGELVLGLVPPEGLQFHIREAIEIAGANRIGHGIDIFYEHDSYDLLQKMKQLDVAVEAIISSNEFILGVRNDGHPMRVYKMHGVSLVIATDDAGVSRSTLSNEYLMYSDRYKPTYAELKALVYNSIRFSFLTDSEKQQQITKLDARFLNFESMIADVARTLGRTGVSSFSPGVQGNIAWITVLSCFIVAL